jgi:hypothetical protein
MRSEGLRPNEITFLGALSACRRSGLPETALWETAMNRYAILPNLEHQTSLVAMFGCIGDFDKAMSAMGMILLDPRRSPDLWLALLGACRKLGNAKLGSVAFDHLLHQLHPMSMPQAMSSSPTTSSPSLACRTMREEAGGL